MLEHNTFDTKPDIFTINLKIVEKIRQKYHQTTQNRETNRLVVFSDKNDNFKKVMIEKHDFSEGHIFCGTLYLYTSSQMMLVDEESKKSTKMYIKSKF